jgi:NAD(P)-dependent dehydrogenase (short-subunit alcohol dehydrogenase family)
VVTGAGAGAGRAIAERFGREGWRVGLISRSESRLQAAREAIEAAGGEALVLPADVADHKAVFAARDRVLDAWGGIDAWVNAAMATVLAPVWDAAPEEYRRATEATYLGCVHGTLAALEPMRRQGRGSIVQVGSALAYRAIPLQSAYCASKFAIRGFTDSLRAELRHQRSAIRVSMIQAPGMNTPQFDWARNHFSHKYQPVGDTFDPDVLAEAVLRAVRHGPREYWVGGSAVQAIVGQMVSPTLMDLYLAKAVWNGQLTDQKEIPGRPDNLFEPAPGDQGARGRFGARAKPRAMIVDPEQARLTFGLAAVAALMAAGAAVAEGFRRR